MKASLRLRAATMCISREWPHPASVRANKSQPKILGSGIHSPLRLRSIFETAREQAETTLARKRPCTWRLLSLWQNASAISVRKGRQDGLLCAAWRKHKDQTTPHLLIVLIELNSETLFSDFTVISKSSVSEAVFFNSTLFFDDVNDPGSIQRPKSEM